MNELSIKLKIAGREFPMKVKSEEEERLRLAGKMINERIFKYQEKFNVIQKNDILIMILLDTFIDYLKSEEKSYSLNSSISNKLNHLNSLIDYSM